MKKIILNADDFGRHELINKAVEIAATEGALRSATLMPAGAAFDDAIEIAKKIPALGVGIHLTLVDDVPISPPETIPTLIKGNGKFYPNYMTFLKAYFTGKISLSDIRCELSAQFEKMERTGLTFTHIDSHQHLHHAPGILEIALNLAEKAGIKKMRISHTKLFSGNVKNLFQIIGRGGLFTLSSYAKLKGKKKGFRYPDHFAGIVAGEAVTETFLLNETENLEEGVTEVMMHPAMDNAKIGNLTGWLHDYEAEFKAATSKKVMSVLKEKNIETTNYNAI